MINITIGTNTSRKKIVVAPSRVLRELLEENGVNIGVGTINIDGFAISREDLNKTLDELGVTNNALIISVAKADNA